MRRQFTLMAMAALAIATSSQAKGIDPSAKFSASPYFMPSKSQRVKNKLNRKRYA